MLETWLCISNKMLLIIVQTRICTSSKIQTHREVKLWWMSNFLLKCLPDKPCCRQGLPLCCLDTCSPWQKADRSKIALINWRTSALSACVHTKRIINYSGCVGTLTCDLCDKSFDQHVVLCSMNSNELILLVSLLCRCKPGVVLTYDSKYGTVGKKL